MGFACRRKTTIQSQALSDDHKQESHSPNDKQPKKPVQMQEESDLGRRTVELQSSEDAKVSYSTDEDEDDGEEDDGMEGSVNKDLGESSTASATCTDSKEKNISDSNDNSTKQSSFLSMRREKRLAMNRASARARRRRSKVLLSSLSSQVSNLTQENQALRERNEKLNERIEQLENALKHAHTTIATLAGDASRKPHDQLISQLAGAAGASPSFLNSGNTRHQPNNENHELLRSLLVTATPAPNTGILASPATPPPQSMPMTLLNDMMLNAQLSRLVAQNSNASQLEAAVAADLRRRLQPPELGDRRPAGTTGTGLPLSTLLARIQQSPSQPQLQQQSNQPQHQHLSYHSPSIASSSVPTSSAHNALFQVGSPSLATLFGHAQLQQQQQSSVVSMNKTDGMSTPTPTTISNNTGTTTGGTSANTARGKRASPREGGSIADAIKRAKR